MNQGHPETRFLPGINAVETNSLGVCEVLSLYSKACRCNTSRVVFDFRNLSNFDGNMSALLLALLHKLKVERRKFTFIELPPHMHVLYRNGFIAHVSGKGNINPYEDNRESTIPLRTFNITEDESFSKYLHADFFGHRGADNINRSIKLNLCNHFIEVYNNVQIHSNSSEPVFTCGQYYPQQKILKFTMADLGEGFLRKINLKTNGDISLDSKAIEWALKDNNSTKDFAKYGPGGTGLKELKKYCEENDGSIQIISGSSMMTFIKGKIVNTNLTNPYYGAIVNLVFRNIKSN